MQDGLNKNWHVVSKVTDDKKHSILLRSFSFPDFAEALQFVNKVGAIAEQQQHHPDITLRWGEVVVQTWTHSEAEITDKDTALAKAIDAIS
ncbi:4a-hydroxytetrahydrobiopterin dehydratase [Candidatus Saccharibacteria bacterium]|nr:4a-hydroxytetrahydrobiopterin dehydratase [Candidatus Saccharibacteria bacterium]